MKELTPLEKKIFNKIIIPSITPPYPGVYLGVETMDQDLDFVILLKKIKEFYKNENGKDFYQVIQKADII